MEPTDVNRRMFDEVHRRRGEGRDGLPSIVKQTLRDLAGKSVLHLHCGSGEGSAELAELGATVTAIDEDDAQLEAAREKRQRDRLASAEASVRREIAPEVVYAETAKRLGERD